MSAPSAFRINGWALLFSGVLLGAGCFWAGRASVHPLLLPGSKPDVVAMVAPQEDDPKVAASLPVTLTKAVPLASPASKSGDQGSSWQDLLAQPGCPARNAAMASWLEKLAATDPDRAMALAQAEGNLKFRESLTQAAVHGWARSAPTNAANWALQLTDSNARERALATVFAGAAAADPAAAVSVARMVMAQNPDEALGCGSSVIAALCANGNFDAAVQMAASGAGPNQPSWMGAAYSQWALFQPAQAAAAAAAIADPALRTEALHGIVGGWSEADPMALVNFVTQLPPDTADRSALLSQSLLRWAKQDPQSAAAWMNIQGPDAGMDQGIAAVATTDALQPDVAMAWAENIVDPKVRSETLVTVLRNWVTTDPAAAEAYFHTTTQLLPDDQQEFAEVLAAIQGRNTGQTAGP